MIKHPKKKSGSPPQKRSSSFRTWLIAVVSLCLVAIGTILWSPLGATYYSIFFDPGIAKHEIALALAEKGIQDHLPEEFVVHHRGKNLRVRPTFGFDETLDRSMRELFNSYKPDYGAFVAIDANSGRILSLISWNKADTWIQDHLALRATFPSASVFKVVTAAAVISEKKMNANSIISYNGSRHTLYKRNLFRDEETRWTQHIPLKEAFAQSINSVFGKLGVYLVGPTELKNYAEKFGFNREIASDLPVQQGKALITEDPWELAETASGFTKTNTMSPLQGALIASAIVNEGRMMEPYVVTSLADETGKLIYEVEPKLSALVIDPKAAGEMRELMRETIESGTSRGSFRGFKTSGGSGVVDVGGKTGSLTGTDPQGKYDWFVGYGTDGERKIATAALTISKEYWKVKSSYLARKAIEVYFKEERPTKIPALTSKKFSLRSAGDEKLARTRSRHRKRK